jgi:hypothetical protein
MKSAAWFIAGIVFTLGVAFCLGSTDEPHRIRTEYKDVI